MEISDLLSSLSAEDMQKLQATARQLLSSAPANETASPSLPGLDPQLLGQIGRVAGLLNAHDPRCDFLQALKPLLREERQRRVDDAAQLLRMFAILPLLKGEGGK